MKGIQLLDYSGNISQEWFDYLDSEITPGCFIGRGYAASSIVKNRALFGMEVANLVFSPSAASSIPATTAAHLGNELLAAARMEAAALLERANAQAECVFEEAHTRGLEIGKSEARSMLMSHIHAEQKILLGAAAIMAELCTIVCREVIGTELQLQPDSIARRIDRALRTIPLASRITVRVHPHDAGYLTTSFAAAAQACELSSDTPGIAEDSSIRPGSAMIVSDYGIVECDIRAHFAEVQQQLRALAAELLRATAEPHSPGRNVNG